MILRVASFYNKREREAERQITPCSSFGTVASSVCRINRTGTTLHPRDSKVRNFAH